MFLTPTVGKGKTRGVQLVSKFGLNELFWMYVRKRVSLVAVVEILMVDFASCVKFI